MLFRSINIAYPVVSLLQALGTGIGMGGAVMYTLNQSSGKNDVAKKYLRCTTTMLFVASIIFYNEACFRTAGGNR